MLFRRSLLTLIVMIFGGNALLAQDTSRVKLVLDTSEVEQALRIMHQANSRQPVEETSWQALFATEPYQWLEAREEQMGRPLTKVSFKTFLLSPSTLSREAEFAHALQAMKQADMPALGAGVLEWLPANAVIQARVFPVIKPQKNSFVWRKPGEEKAIFLALEALSTDKFKNTVSHECHHIGLSSLDSLQEKVLSTATPQARLATQWLTAFGEGIAMLAAAGSDDRHPHWEDGALERARWDGDMMHLNADVPAIQQLLFDILDGKLTGDQQIMKRAAPFWGDAQGAWYTVGYEMAVLVDRRFGRQALTEAMIDPRKLLILYNQIAQEANAKGASLATWSPQLLERLQATAVHQ